MNDERMQPLLEGWFKDREVAPTNVQHSARQVMAKVPEVRQRGRWWPLPTFHRKAKTQSPTATDTTDYRPSPIPATNGHAPTVIGRTQTMFSPVKAITAGALVFALGGVLLIAQPFDQGGTVPGAEQGAEPEPPVSVTGTMNWGEDCTHTEQPERLHEPPAERERDWHMDCEARASDPRVSGTWSIVRNGFWYDDIGQGMLWGTATLDGADGGWECTYTDIGDPYPENPVDDLYRFVCSGTGGFEGLRYVWHWGVNGPEGFWDDITIVGFIFPDPPPGWGPPLPTLE